METIAKQKRPRISITLTDGTLAKAKQKCELEGRKMSSLIEVLLLKWLRGSAEK